MMYNYRVTGAFVNIPAGSLLRLDVDQVRARLASLIATEKQDTFLTRAAVQFKRGEEFYCDQEIDKLQIDAVENINTAAVSAVEAEDEAEAEAEAEAEGQAAEDVEEEVVYYEDMTKVELQAVCEERGLDYKNRASKQDLIDTLIEADE